MFGFSLTELIVVLIAILIFIKPSDLPEIAHFFGKVFYRAKSFYSDLKKSFKEMEKEFEIEDLKQELHRGIAEEKTRFEEETTIIVDLYGNEHRVPKVVEEKMPEVGKLNEVNSNQKSDLK